MARRSPRHAGCTTGRSMTAIAVGTITMLSLSALQGCPPGQPGEPDAAVGIPDAVPRPAIAADQLVFDSTRSSSNHEIFVMNRDGSSAARLTNDPAYENWWPRISPDRTRVLFYRSPAGDPEDYSAASLWLMNADGTGVTQLRA